MQHQIKPSNGVGRANESVPHVTCPFDHTRANIEEFHDATEEDGAPSNKPYNVCIQEEMMNKQDRGTK